MENASPLDEKLQILKRIEEIGNRDFDGVDSTKLLKNYLASGDAEIILSSLQAASNNLVDESLFQEIFKMAKEYEDEEIRAMANSCLGAAIHDGIEFEETWPQGFPGAGRAIIAREFYFEIREFLVRNVDAPMESMEVRRRALEALGYLAYLPEIRKIVMRFYQQAPNPQVKVSAIYAMGLVRDAIFEKLILEELYSPDEGILIEAIHSAVGLDLHAAFERVLQLSKSLNPELKYEAIAGLGVIAPLDQLPDILRSLEAVEKNPDTREAIALAKNYLNQRLAEKQGDPFWNDQILRNEIDDLLELPDSNNDAPTDEHPDQ